MTPAAARAWLRDSCLPFWRDHGVDRARGAFHEDIDPTTLRPRAEFRRVRVAFRQVYSFARGAALGVPGSLELVELGLDFMRAHARLPEGGYAARFDLDNRIIDPTLDLYEQAFGLLALSHAARVTDRETLRREALDHLAFIERRFRHPGLGFKETAAGGLPRRQNPHMHLLEATLSAYESFGDAVFLDRADEIVGLFLDRFYQPDAPGLPEYFDDALAPERDAAGRFVLEPGHHFEWVWLLGEHRRIARAAGRTPRDTTAAAAGLLEFAERHGVSEAGDPVAELWSDGSARTDVVRIWPYTERLKALVCQGDARWPGALDALGRCFEGVPPGLWHERKGQQGFLPGEVAPASSVYHITCAILELPQDDG